MLKIEQQRLFDTIKPHQIDLTGYTVLTEAASGAYLYTSLLCTLAGAKKTYFQSLNKTVI